MGLLKINPTLSKIIIGASLLATVGGALAGVTFEEMLALRRAEKEAVELRRAEIFTRENRLKKDIQEQLTRKYNPSAAAGGGGGGLSRMSPAAGGGGGGGLSRTAAGEPLRKRPRTGSLDSYFHDESSRARSLDSFFKFHRGDIRVRDVDSLSTYSSVSSLSTPKSFPSSNHSISSVPYGFRKHHQYFPFDEDIDDRVAAWRYDHFITFRSEYYGGTPPPIGDELGRVKIFESNREWRESFWRYNTKELDYLRRKGLSEQEIFESEQRRRPLCRQSFFPRDDHSSTCTSCWSYRTRSSVSESTHSERSSLRCFENGTLRSSISSITLDSALDVESL